MLVCMVGVVYSLGEICVGQICVCGDEPLVGTVILPQIGELPVHLSIGEV